MQTRLFAWSSATIASVTLDDQPPPQHRQRTSAETATYVVSPFLCLIKQRLMGWAWPASLYIRFRTFVRSVRLSGPFFVRLTGLSLNPPVRPVLPSIRLFGHLFDQICAGPWS